MLIDPKFLLFLPYIMSHALNLAIYFALDINFFVHVITEDPSMEQYDTDDKKNQQAVWLFILFGIGLIFGASLTGLI